MWRNFPLDNISWGEFLHMTPIKISPNFSRWLHFGWGDVFSNTMVMSMSTEIITLGGKWWSELYSGRWWAVPVVVEVTYIRVSFLNRTPAFLCPHHHIFSRVLPTRRRVREFLKYTLQWLPLTMMTLITISHSALPELSPPFVALEMFVITSVWLCQLLDTIRESDRSSH